ncbi:MAG: hypothetical protein WAQ52_10540 [Terriglobales bacterium]
MRRIWGYGECVDGRRKRPETQFVGDNVADQGTGDTGPVLGGKFMPMVPALEEPVGVSVLKELVHRKGDDLSLGADTEWQKGNWPEGNGEDRPLDRQTSYSAVHRAAARALLLLFASASIGA